MNKHRDKKSSESPEASAHASLRKNTEPLPQSTGAGRALERMLEGNKGPTAQERHRVHCENLLQKREAKKGFEEKSVSSDLCF